MGWSYWLDVEEDLLSLKTCGLFTIDIAPEEPSCFINEEIELRPVFKDINGNVVQRHLYYETEWQSLDLEKASLVSPPIGQGEHPGVFLCHSEGTAPIQLLWPKYYRIEPGEADLQVKCKAEIELPEALLQSDRQMAIGENMQLVAKINGITAQGPAVRWTSSDDSKAQVDPDTGLVTAKNVGEVTITVESRECQSVATASVTLTIVDCLSWRHVCEVRIVGPPDQAVDWGGTIELEAKLWSLAADKELPPRPSEQLTWGTSGILGSDGAILYEVLPDNKILVTGATLGCLFVSAHWGPGAFGRYWLDVRAAYAGTQIPIDTKYIEPIGRYQGCRYRVTGYLPVRANFETQGSSLYQGTLWWDSLLLVRYSPVKEPDDEERERCEYHEGIVHYGGGPLFLVVDLSTLNVISIDLGLSSFEGTLSQSALSGVLNWYCWFGSGTSAVALTRVSR
jgi:hypothetical protein